MASISEKAVSELPLPELDEKGKRKRNYLRFFSGAVVQGKTAPSGFAVRVTDVGTKSFVWVHRVDGRQFVETIGTWHRSSNGGTLTVYDAVVQAAERAKEVGRGFKIVGKGKDQQKIEVDAMPARVRAREDRKLPKGKTIAGLLDDFVTRYAEKERKLRSTETIKSAFERLVKPSIGWIGIYDLKRANINEMLDKIADKNGLVMADRTLAYVRKAFNWYAVRDEDFTSPIVRGMSRTKPSERSRTRILDDAEIRDIWRALAAADVPVCYPRFVQMLLLTATRRNEVADMHIMEMAGDVWTIPSTRYKTKTDHVIPLSAEALALVGEAKGFVFSTDGGRTAFSGFSKGKIALDRTIAKTREAEGRDPMPNWTLHDLRRTARSLMSRAGVSSDHAERSLGHVILGVEKTYDRYAYLKEKRAAFVALAALVNRILNPQDNVIPLHG